MVGEGVPKCWPTARIPIEIGRLTSAAVVYEDFIVAYMVGVDVFYGEVVDDGGDCLIGEGDYSGVVSRDCFEDVTGP